jgi:glycosyltransferase involved in cell wall biosynthesis
MHAKLRFFELGFCGVAEARNFAIQQAHGTICAILDSDDYMLPGRLQLQTDIFKTTPGSVAVGGNFIGLIQRTNPIFKLLLKSRKYFVMPQSRDDIGIFIESGISPITHSTLSFKKEIFIRLGGYSLQMEKSEDFDLILRMYYEGGVYSINQAVSIINFGRPNSHTTRHKPKKRDGLYYALFAVLRNYNEREQLGFSKEEIESKLDQFQIGDLGLLQLKWYITNLRKSRSKDLYLQWKLVLLKVMQQFFKKNSFENFFRFPTTKEVLMKESSKSFYEI